MQAMGAAITGAGDVAGDIAVTIQRGTDQGVKSRAALAWQNALAAHQEFRAQNPDESRWEANLESNISKARESIDFDKASPAMRAELDATFSGWESDAIHGTRIDALTQRHRLDKYSLDQDVEIRLQYGDKEGADARVREGVAGGIYHPKEGEIKLKSNEETQREFDKKKAKQDAFDEIDRDWFAVEDRYKSSVPPPGENEAEYQLKRERVFARKAEEQRRILDEVSERMNSEDPSNKITSANDIDEEDQKRLGPTFMAKVNDSIEKDTVNKIKEYHRNPSYQTKTIGIIAAQVDKIDKRDVEGQFNMHRLLNTIEDGPIKSHLESRLKDRIDGSPPKTTAVDVTARVINSMAKNNFFGQVDKLPAPQATADALRDGFLKDKSKLKLLFSEKDAKAITTAKDDNARLNEFLRLYETRNSYKDNPNDFTIRTAKAIAGRKNDIPYTPDEINKAGTEKLNAQIAHANTLSAFLTWAYDHPKDAEVPEKCHEAMKKIVGPTKRQAYLDAALKDGEDNSSFLPGDIYIEPAKSSGNPSRPNYPSGQGGISADLLPDKPFYGDPNDLPPP